MFSCKTIPLDSLDELWDWDGSKVDKRLVGAPLKFYSGDCSAGPKTLLCHDMMGGYLPEEDIDGCIVDGPIKPYIFMHWWYIDIFTYFSHHFITIPPVCWITQAHNHGVLVLGTFITEGKGGAKICKEMLKDDETVNKTVMQLVSIAVVYNFDGWLINIENSIEKNDIFMLDNFLASLTTEMRSAIGSRSRVIWYDAVTNDGRLEWQNQLNPLNERWFDLTNGIFTNYGWQPNDLVNSKLRAKERSSEVYVGVDCFGRGCYGGGGWNCYKAFAHAYDSELSIALFAPGWIAQRFPRDKIILNSIRFWDRLAPLVKPHEIRELPIETDFSIGLTTAENGCMHYNPSKAATQPFYLESNAFPKSSTPALVLPNPGDYILFLTNISVTGQHKIEVVADTQLRLLLYVDYAKRSPIEIECDKCSSDGIWYINFKTSLIFAIGMRAANLTMVTNFSFSKVPEAQMIESTKEVHDFPPIKNANP